MFITFYIICRFFTFVYSGHELIPHEALFLFCDEGDHCKTTCPTLTQIEISVRFEVYVCNIIVVILSLSTIWNCDNRLFNVHDNYI
jgi:hypothetical protein